MSTEITTLTTLANGIRQKHQAALDAAANAVTLAREAGELLIEAKAQVEHGQWSDWLKANVQFSERTAQGYMRLARELPKLDHEKAQHVAVLPLRQALRAISSQQDVKIEYDPELEAFRICQDINEAVIDWNYATSILIGEKDGDISTACSFIDMIEHKHKARMGFYREGLHRIASAGLAYAHPLYQTALKAVSTMESLGHEISEIRAIQADIRSEANHA